MTRSLPSVLSLGLALVGCDGTTGECGSCDQTVGSDQDTEDCSTCGDDTGSDPPAMGSFTAPQVVLPDGSLEDCTSNLISTNTYSVPSGTTEDVAADEYDLTFGDFALASDFSDGLPVHTASDGGLWIAPAQTTSVEANKATAPEVPAVSRYVGGETWTCNDSGSTDSSISATFVMAYTDDGNEQLELEFDGGSMFITGEEVFYTDSDCNNGGSFVNSEQLSYSIVCSWTNISRQCWAGEESDRPTDDMW